MVATSPMLVSGFWNVVQASEKLVFKYLILTKLTQAQGSSGYHTGQHHPIPFTHWFLVLQHLCMLVSSPLKIIPHRAVKGMLLLSHFSHVWLCATPYMAAHQATLSLGFSRQEHWSRLPFPSPTHESEKWKLTLGRVQLLATPWTAAYKAPLFMGFSRQEYWSGVPLPSPVKGIEQGKPQKGLGSVPEMWDILLQYLFAPSSPMFPQQSPLSDS